MNSYNNKTFVHNCPFQFCTLLFMRPIDCTALSWGLFSGPEDSENFFTEFQVS